MLDWGVQRHDHDHGDDHYQQQHQQHGCRKGPWTPEEDKLLAEYVTSHGEGRWSSVAKCAGKLFLCDYRFIYLLYIYIHM